MGEGSIAAFGAIGSSGDDSRKVGASAVGEARLAGIFSTGCADGTIQSRGRGRNRRGGGGGDCGRTSASGEIYVRSVAGSLRVCGVGGHIVESVTGETCD